ncbi:hypothetical protein [Salipiger mucosus]|uniref:Uncharacterized protein n=1 Tax=Salipiger mucosus DSM 16094 TaxID=1123237 RepID=S9RVC6_9RHOB|nr:hypothetical protein [Salipiger mucosus]EPX81965.1 hypothetical protein Salmuc_00279 [Salipiger mucosus DSM 16094]
MAQFRPSRREAPRSIAVTAPRPRPTAGAALLAASVLSIPFVLLALFQALS